MNKDRFLIDSDGEVGDLGDSFFVIVWCGCLVLLLGDKKVCMNLMIDVDIVVKLNDVGNKSVFVIEVLWKVLVG